MISDLSLKAAKEAALVAKVRLTGDGFVARIGKGKDAVTSSSTTHAAIAAIVAAKKALGLEEFLARKLIAKQIPQQGQLPGIRIKEERGVTYWRIGLPVAEGGVL